MKSRSKNAPFFIMQNAPFFDMDEFEAMLLEAARTITRQPPVRPAGYGSAWPDTLPNKFAYDRYGERPRLGPPTSREVTRLDIVLNTLWHADPEDVRLAWHVAFSAQRAGWPRSRGPAWAMLGHKLGIHPQTLRRRFSASLERIWRSGVAKGPLIKT